MDPHKCMQVLPFQSHREHTTTDSCRLGKLEQFKLKKKYKYEVWKGDYIIMRISRNERFVGLWVWNMGITGITYPLQTSVWKIMVQQLQKRGLRFSHHLRGHSNYTMHQPRLFPSGYPKPFMANHHSPPGGRCIDSIRLRQTHFLGTQMREFCSC